MQLVNAKYWDYARRESLNLLTLPHTLEWDQLTTEEKVNILSYLKVKEMVENGEVGC